MVNHPVAPLPSLVWLGHPARVTIPVAGFRVGGTLVGMVDQHERSEDRKRKGDPADDPDGCLGGLILTDGVFSLLTLLPDFMAVPLLLLSGGGCLLALICTGIATGIVIYWAA
ncbi:MAG: hypothetical protein WBC44_03025 [Planctomycetaceae bacterium]